MRSLLRCSLFYKCIFIILFLLSITNLSVAQKNRNKGSTKTDTSVDEKKPLHLNVQIGEQTLIENDYLFAVTGKTHFTSIIKKRNPSVLLDNFIKNKRVKKVAKKLSDTHAKLVIGKEVEVTRLKISQTIPLKADPEGMLNVTMYQPTTSSLASNVIAIVSNWNTTLDTPLPVINTNRLSEKGYVPARPISFDLEFHCVIAGNFTITLNFGFMPANQLKLKNPNSMGHALIHRFSTSFTKECQPIKKGSRFDNIPGFSISSEPARKDDVMVNGKALNLYRPDVILKVDTKGKVVIPDDIYLVARGIKTHTFYTHYSSSNSLVRHLDITSTTALSHEKFVKASIIGHASRPYRLATFAPLTKITVQIICTEVGDSVVSVTFNIMNNGVLPKFSFVKRCGEEDLSTSGFAPLPVICDGGMCGLTMGTVKGGSDIVLSGNVKDGYGETDDDAKRFIVASGLEYSAETIYIGSAASTLDIEGIDVVSQSPQNLAIVMPNHNKWIMIRLQQGQSLPLYVEYRCLTVGTYTVNLVLHSEENKRLVWKKQCSQIDVDTYASKIDENSESEPTPSDSTDSNISDSESGESNQTPKPAKITYNPELFDHNPILPGLTLVLFDNKPKTKIPDNSEDVDISTEMSDSPSLDSESVVKPTDENIVVVGDGVTRPMYHPITATEKGSLFMDTKDTFISFFGLVMNTEGAREYNLGYPLVTPFTPIVNPFVYGEGSNGVVLSPTDNTFTTLSLSLTCKGVGSTWVKVSIPILPLHSDPQEYITTDFDYVMERDDERKGPATVTIPRDHKKKPNAKKITDDKNTSNPAISTASDMKPQSFDVLSDSTYFSETSITSTSTSSNDNSVSEKEEKENSRKRNNLVFYFKKKCGVIDLDKDSDDIHQGSSLANLGGVAITGLQIGSKTGGFDIVRDGLPTRDYYGRSSVVSESKSKSRKSVIIPASQSSSTFYIGYFIPEIEHSSNEFILAPSITLGNPSVTPLSAAVSPLLSGSFLGGATVGLKDAPLELTVTYNCNFKDVADMTIIIPVLPKGSIIFTISKECAGRQLQREKQITGLEMSLLVPNCGSFLATDDKLTTEEKDLFKNALKDAAEEHIKNTQVNEENQSLLPSFSFSLTPKPNKPTPPKTSSPSSPSPSSPSQSTTLCSPGTLRVVRNGLPLTAFSSVSSTNSDSGKNNGKSKSNTNKSLSLHRVPASTNSLSFAVKLKGKTGTLRKNATPIFAVEPWVQCLRPICKATLSHNLFLNQALLKNIEGGKTYKGTVVPDAVLQPDIKATVIDDLAKRIDISLTCIYPGISTVQVSIPLYPDSAITFSFIKECTEDLMEDSVLLDEDGNLGVRSGSWSRHDEISKKLDPFFQHPFANLRMDKNVCGYLDVGTAKTNIFTLTNVVYRGVPRVAYRAVREENTVDTVVTYKEAKKLTKEAQEAALETGSSWSAWSDWWYTGVQQRSSIGVGADDLLTDEDYALLSDIDPTGKYAIVAPSQKTSRFFFSINPDKRVYQPIGAPFVKTLSNNRGETIVQASITGPLIHGANITNTISNPKTKTLSTSEDTKKFDPTRTPLVYSGEAYIDVEFQCLRKGYTSALIVVPLYPISLGSVSWRVIKLCAGVKPSKTSLYTYMSVIYFTVLFVPLLLLLLCNKRCIKHIKAFWYSISSGVENEDSEFADIKYRNVNMNEDDEFDRFEQEPEITVNIPGRGKDNTNTINSNTANLDSDSDCDLDCTLDSDLDLTDDDDEPTNNITNNITVESATHIPLVPPEDNTDSTSQSQEISHNTVQNVLGLD